MGVGSRGEKGCFVVQLIDYDKGILLLAQYPYVSTSIRSLDSARYLAGQIL